MVGSAGYPRRSQVTAPLKGEKLRSSLTCPARPAGSRDDGWCTLGSGSAWRHRENQHYHSPSREAARACATRSAVAHVQQRPAPWTTPPQAPPSGLVPPPQARSAPEPRTSISGFRPPPLLPPPPLPLSSPSPVRSGVIPDQDGGRGASRLVRFISTRASLDLRQRTPSQRACVGQRRPRGGRR